MTRVITKSRLEGRDRGEGRDQIEDIGWEGLREAKVKLGRLSFENQVYLHNFPLIG